MCNLLFHCILYTYFKFTVPPNQPGDFQVVGYAPKWVSLTWSAPWASEQGSPLSHYEVTYINEGGSGVTDLAKTTSTQIGSLSYGSTYKFQVVAVSGAGGVMGRSPPSEPIYFSGK